MPVGFSVVQRFWSVGDVVGATLLIWGDCCDRGWPTVFGATLIVYGQLWRIDRLGILYE